ncbi:MAG TPA: biotin/lipoyl-containing protein, partial [Angustibacter sp.]|nr:biotin/lipoyl-containing protein [Angustibacter sp.]
IEFRINGEDAGRGFLPAPGSVTVFHPPTGPGVRLDSGVESGDVIAGAFDSMLAKLIITGSSRQQALERSRRALDEFVIEGMPTVLPFHRAVVRDEAFAPADTSAPFTVHTRWIETEFDNQIEPFAGGAAEGAEPEERQQVVVEVGGKRLEVSLPAGFAVGGNGGGAVAKAKAPKRSARSSSGAAAGGDALTAPMQGTIVKITVEEGHVVEAGQLVVVLEAMKMEQPITAHKAGVVAGLKAEIGQTVTSGAVLLELKDHSGDTEDA